MLKIDGSSDWEVRNDMNTRYLEIIIIYLCVLLNADGERTLRIHLNVWDKLRSLRPKAQEEKSLGLWNHDLGFGYAEDT